MKSLFNSSRILDGVCPTTFFSKRKYVSKSSSLVTIFNSRPGPQLKLNFKKNTGLFGLDELKSFDGFYLLKENVITETNRLISETTDTSRKRKIVDVFDELSDTLCRVADLAEFVRLAHPQPVFANAAEDACIAVSGIVEKLNTHKKLYDNLKKVYDNGDIADTTPMDNHVAGLFLSDFEQSGIHLDEHQRQSVVGLNNYSLQLGQRFMAGTLEPRIVPSSSLPIEIRQYFRSDGANLMVNSLYSDSNREDVREAAYKVFLQPDENQDFLLNEMLKARHELAELCGFTSFGHRALKLSLAEKPSMVYDFLNELSQDLAPRVKEDFDTLYSVKKSLESNSRPIAPWDVPYLSSKVKRDWSKIEPKEYMPYFSLGTCMEGLSNLMYNLYGIRLVNEQIENGETWSPDIYKLAVTHETEGVLGFIYCDFYERSGKPNQDCHFTIRCGRELNDSSYQAPIVVVSLSLPPPAWGSPCLLSAAMLENLFHEFGHAMHSMLGRTKHQHVAGTRCPTDFAEVPSVLMEYFASDPRVLGSFAKHYDTGEPMPEKMLKAVCSSKHLLSASETQLQLFYSMLDQKLHTTYPLSGSTTDLLAEIQNEYYSLPHVKGTAWHLRFSHLVGYGAKYYSYLMSRAIASLIWQRCFAKDPLDRASGEAYRHQVLAHGGSKPVRNLLDDFLKFKVTPLALGEALAQDMDTKYKVVNLN